MPCGLQGELDELEREEFFRLKKVQNKKQKNVPVSVSNILVSAAKAYAI